ncbi:protein of unknown function [Beijerinckiaceae bacterium RH AL1]|nr:protein of unknown function [Beijerinckiaceae bacterium RH CH11]VVB46807.1 protein of unknown function [Beijerinckiaceae bacterium RH AL8]VVC55523.1 protein of unknown function [Beijerinckiaceae bacterium RH AL1]
MPRSIFRSFVTLILVWLSLAAALPTAKAMTFTCIESSRYAPLSLLFGGDTGKLKEALGQAQLPPANACRAIFASGTTERGDPERLAAVLIANRGWIDTVYLNSGGGEVGPANESGFLIRDFWLNTVVMPAGKFIYPASSLGLSRGGVDDGAIQTYERAVGGYAIALKSPWCASACTFLLAAGASRTGVADVHRCRAPGKTIQEEGANADRCLDSSMRRYYETMGTGQAIIDAALSTAKATTTPMTMPRFAPTVEDALLQRCGSDLAQLDDLTTLIGYDDKGAWTMQSLDINDHLPALLKRIEERRRTTDACVRRIHERDRLSAFARYCGYGCSVRSLMDALSLQLAELRK